MLLAVLVLPGGCLSFSGRSASLLPVQSDFESEHSDEQPNDVRPIDFRAALSEFSSPLTARGLNREIAPQSSKSRDEVADPFLLFLQSKTDSSATPTSLIEEPDSISKPIEVAPKIDNDSQTTNDKNESIIATETSSGAVTVASMEADLLKNNWVRNHELTRWLENGMKNPNEKRNAEQLKRLANINRLNMSSDEIRKKGDQGFEYSDGLLSTWRWHHPEIENILNVSPEKRPDPVVFLRDEKYDGDQYRTLRANVAVLMGRTNDQLAKKYLLQAVADKNLRVPLRCAAAETLGKLDNVSAKELISLIEPVKERLTMSVNPLTELPEERFVQGVRELWAELLVSVSEKIAPWEHPCFIEPLQSRDPKMRLETVRLWQSPEKYALKFSNHTTGTDKKSINEQKRLPEEFLDYARSEIDLTIRIEIIRTLGAWKDPEIFEIVRADLNKGPALCHATLDALAEAGCKEAIPLAKEKLHDTVGRNRAKAVQTLRKLGCLDDVFRLHDDQAWEVRIEVAKSIADRCSPQTAKLARDCLSDTARVQEATIDAVATWPIEDAAPILLEALKCNLQTTRSRALNVLARHIPEAKRYDVVAKPERVEEDRLALADLFDEFIEQKKTSKTQTRGVMPEKPSNRSSISPVAFLEHGDSPRSNSDRDPDLLQLAEVRRLLDEWTRPGKSWGEREACLQRLASLEDRLLPIVEYLYDIDRRVFPDSLDDVLAKNDPLFAVILRLDGEDVSDRRRAATELNRWSRIREIGGFTSYRIRQRTDGETDPQTLAILLETLENVDADAARHLALSMLEDRKDSVAQPIPQEFRRRACSLLSRQGTPEDLPALAESLYDRNPEIVRAVLEAIVGILENEQQKPNIFDEPYHEIVQILKSLLMQEDRMLQADAAVTLHVCGDPAGEEALRRLSCSKDSKVRLYAVHCIGSLEDPVFVPILIHLLDDRGNVRQSALKTLPKLVGKDVGSTKTNDARFAELSETDRKVALWKSWAEQQTLN